MATIRQLALRLKYAKNAVTKLTKQLAAAKAKARKLEGDLKKAKAAEQKSKPKKAAPKKKRAAAKKK